MSALLNHGVLYGVVFVRAKILVLILMQTAGLLLPLSACPSHLCFLPGSASCACVPFSHVVYNCNSPFSEGRVQFRPQSSL